MIIDILSKKLASIKRHFMSSPFEMILQAVESNHREKGNRKVNNLCYFTKQEQKEKVWIAFEGT